MRTYLTDSFNLEETYYQRNLPDVTRDFFTAALGWTDLLPTRKQQNFVRLVLVSVGQWALDCKKDIPTWHELRKQFCDQIKTALDGHYQYLSKAAAITKMPRSRLTRMRRIINRSSEDSDEDGTVPQHWLPAKLVVTSPPYPGVIYYYVGSCLD